LKEEIAVDRRSSVLKLSVLKLSVLKLSVLKLSVLNGVLVALAVAGFAGALLTGCERTISDDGSWLSESVR
jgi:hypothetical protein